MAEQRLLAAREGKEEELAAARRLAEGLPFHLFLESGGVAANRFLVADLDARDLLPRKEGGEIAADGFDFGEFGHLAGKRVFCREEFLRAIKRTGIRIRGSFIFLIPLIYLEEDKKKVFLLPSEGSVSRTSNNFFPAASE